MIIILYRSILLIADEFLVIDFQPLVNIVTGFPACVMDTGSRQNYAF
jgi:hypothetical protein